MGTVKVPLFTNDGTTSGMTRPYVRNINLWQTNSDNNRTGKSALYGWDPDPAAYGDPSSSSVLTLPVDLPGDQPAFLHFDQWRLFQWTDGATPTYNDGGTVSVATAPDASGTFLDQPMPADAWANGPGEELALTDPAHPVLGASEATATAGPRRGSTSAASPGGR